MNRFLATAALVAIILPVQAVAQNAIEGNWRIDPSDMHMPTQVVLLQNGKYECKSCAPPISVPADGSDHAVAGLPDVDTLAIKVVNAHAVQMIEKKNGNIVFAVTATVAPNGKSKTTEVSQGVGSAPIRMTSTLLTKGPAGSHAISGTWEGRGASNAPEASLKFTYTMDGGLLHMKTGTGDWYIARMDGGDSQYFGGSEGKTVSVKAMGKNAMLETYKNGGKATDTALYEVSTDGKSVKITHTALVKGTTDIMNAKRQ
jgi:hypothetical protein